MSTEPTITRLKDMKDGPMKSICQREVALATEEALRSLANDMEEAFDGLMEFDEQNLGYSLAVTDIRKNLHILMNERGIFPRKETE